MSDRKELIQAVQQLLASLDTILSLCPELGTDHLEPSQEASLQQELANEPMLAVARTLRLAHAHNTPVSLKQLLSTKIEEMFDYRAASAAARAELQTNPAAWPPALPEITDRSMRDQVFTHRSISSHTNRNNERLEFIGDSALNTIVTDLVFDRFPDFTEGQLTHVRSELVRNQTISGWAVEYGLDKCLKTQVPIHQEAAGIRSKIIADVMEAYIGALYLESRRGLTKVRNWITALCEPYLAEVERGQVNLEPLNKSAKNELYLRIGSIASKPEYVVAVEGNSQSPYTVHCVVQGKVIGIGVGPSTKEAGLRAAMQALESDLSTIEDLRRSGMDRPESEQTQQPPRKKVALAPKDQLYGKVGSDHRRPHYVTSHINGQFFARVYLGDEELGGGYGPNKREAEHKAASVALSNPQLSKWLNNKTE